jgi:hypothetical protein
MHLQGSINFGNRPNDYRSEAKSHFQGVYGDKSSLNEEVAAKIKGIHFSIGGPEKM